MLSPLGTLVVLAFLIVVAIMWLILPFAVFGIKKRLDVLIEIERARK